MLGSGVVDAPAWGEVPGIGDAQGPRKAHRSIEETQTLEDAITCRFNFNHRVLWVYAEFWYSRDFRLQGDPELLLNQIFKEFYLEIRKQVKAFHRLYKLYEFDFYQYNLRKWCKSCPFMTLQVFHPGLLGGS